MSLLEHHSAVHSVGPGDLDVGRSADAEHVRVVPSQAVDEDPPTGLAEERSTDMLADLLLAVGCGDREACAALQRRIGGLVRVNIRRVLRDASSSDAVTQEFFAEVPREVTSFDPDRDSAQAWLLTRAHLRALRQLTSAQALDGTTSS